MCSGKELLNLKDSKLTQIFYGNKTGFVRPGHKYFKALKQNCMTLLEYQAIKDLSQVQSSDQGNFSLIKNLDPGRKWFYRPYESDYRYTVLFIYCNMNGCILCT